jgi:homoserine O-acetyltransferase/O-succinyltransferase
VNAAVNSAVEHTVSIGTLTLESGETLHDVEQRVTIYGDRSARTVLAPHALTGSSRVLDWWPGIAGENALFDPNEWCIIGINALGSCYGSTGPSTRRNFPRVTVADIVRAQSSALDELGLERLDVVAGGSLGGMQALQWALDTPERVRSAIVIGAHDHHSAMGVALNAVQREALGLDPVRGLRLARKIAMLTYKSEELFNERHDRRTDRHGKPYFDVEGYLELQADRFEARMDAATYAILTHAMDSFDVRSVARRDQSRNAKPKLCFVGINSDWLFRPEDIRRAAERFSTSGWPSHYLELCSKHGHDAFLAEGQPLADLLRSVVNGA